MEKTKLMETISKVQLLISDVDGVLTDGSIFISGTGEEFKQFTVEDGVGVAFAKLAGLPVALISGRFSKATAQRAKELKIEHCFQGKLNKIDTFEKLCGIYKVQPGETAYVGDGLIDIPVMERVGFAVTVPGAPDLVKKVSHLVTKRSGGKGVLREVIELILTTQGVFNTTLEKMRREIYLA